MEGSRALDVGFQCFDCRNELIDKIFECLQGLIQVAELLECFLSENMNASKVIDQFVLPAVDVEEGALLVNGHGLEHAMSPTGSRHLGEMKISTNDGK